MSGAFLRRFPVPPVSSVLGARRWFSGWLRYNEGMRIICAAALLVLAGCALAPHQETIGAQRRIAAFPLFYAEKTADTTNSVVFPLLYFHHRDPEGVYASVFPLFRYTRAKRTTDWHLLGGLAAYHHEPEAAFKRLNVPLVGWERKPHERGFFIFPLITTRTRRGHPELEDFNRVTLLGPLCTLYRRDDYYLLKFLGPLVSTSKGLDNDVNVLTLRLFPAFSYSKRWELSGRAEGCLLFERKFNLAGPLLTIHEDNYGAGYRRVDFLWPFVRFTRGYPRSPREREVTFFLLPLLGWGKFWSYDVTGSLERYKSEFYLLDPFMRYRKDSIDGTDLRILAGVIYWHRNPSGDRDFRILGRVIRAARQGEAREVGLWPLFKNQWNRAENTRRTIVLGGLFYYRRDADGRTTKRILWLIPIGRRDEPAIEEEEGGEGDGGSGSNRQLSPDE